MPEIRPGTSAQVFTDAMRQALADALSKTLSSTWDVQVSTDDVASSDPATLLCFAASPAGGLQGNAAFQLHSEDALFLAQKLVGPTPQPAAQLNDDHRQAVEKFLCQVAEIAVAA